MKRLSLALLLLLGVCIMPAGAQTYKATYATKLFLSGGGSPINPLTIQSPVLGSPYTLTLPPDAGTNGYLLQTDGSGNLTWVTPPSSTVSTNATLTGDGSVGTPLGINLANSNTWTANQTFAGTFLITANSRIAMTNSDNNARDIRLQEPSGTGSQYIGLRAPNLSDNGNYVLPAIVGASGDLLSISSTNGIDSATLAWTTPSSGTVTHNATLTGNGTVGSPLGINLANSNTWTANQTFAGTFLITANSRIAMTNSDNNARDIRLQEPSGTGTQYIGFRAPSVTNNGNYVLPAVVGTTGQVLTIASGNSIDSASLSWTTVSGGTSTVDSTLIGDGSGGSPLGIDLAQVNTWTATITTFIGFLEVRNDPLVITNTDNIANEVRWQEASGNGSNFFAIKAGASISSNGTYTWPTATGTSGQVLAIAASPAPTSTTATLEWAAAGGGNPTFSYVHKVSSVTATYTATTSDGIIGVDQSSGTAFTLTLPSSVSAGVGKLIIVKLESQNTGTFPVLTVSRGGSDLIDGGTSVTFSNSGGFRHFYSDGTGNWYTW